MDKHINLLEIYTSVVTDIEKHYPQLTKNNKGGTEQKKYRKKVTNLTPKKKKRK